MVNKLHKFMLMVSNLDNNKKITVALFFLMLLGQCQLLYAGVHGLTWHSRANCGGFNESITWRAGFSYWLETFSKHVAGPARVNESHSGTSYKEFTWRSANCHFAEGWNGDGWFVYGAHWISNDGGKNWVILGYTEASDCSIYDGWWG